MQLGSLLFFCYTLAMWWILFLIDLAVIALHIFARQKLGFFDLDKEGNLNSVYSGLKLWGVGGLAFVHAAIISKLNVRWWRSWLWIAFGAGLIYIGLDDMMVLHERLGFVINNLTGNGGFYGESFNWLFYFLPAMIAAVIVFVALIRELWRDSHSAAVWLLFGLGLWVASIGSEFVGRQLLLAETINVPLYHRLIIAEEAFEMFGASCIAVAVSVAVRALVHARVRIN